MFNLPGGLEWIIILAIVLIIFGGKRIPELMGGLGKGIKNFKRGLKAEESDDVITHKKATGAEDQINEIDNSTKDS
jgi:sec-independent protein translocase protein TatA